MRATGTLQADSRHLLIDGALTSSSLRQGLGGLVAEFTEGAPGHPHRNQHGAGEDDR